MESLNLGPKQVLETSTESSSYKLISLGLTGKLFLQNNIQLDDLFWCKQLVCAMTGCEINSLFSAVKKQENSSTLSTVLLLCGSKGVSVQAGLQQSGLFKGSETVPSRGNGPIIKTEHERQSPTSRIIKDVKKIQDWFWFSPGGMKKAIVFYQTLIHWQLEGKIQIPTIITLIIISSAAIFRSWLDDPNGWFEG